MRAARRLTALALLLWVLSWPACAGRKTEPSRGPAPSAQATPRADAAGTGKGAPEAESPVATRPKSRDPFLTKVREFTGGDGDVTDVAFSPAGDLLAAAAFRSVDVYEVATGRRVATAPDAAGRIAFTSDGKALAVVTPRGEFSAYRLPSPSTAGPVPAALMPVKEAQGLGLKGAVVVAVQPGRPTLAVAIGGPNPKVQFVNTSTWKVERETRIESLPAKSGFSPETIRFSPDGEYLAMDGILLDPDGKYDSYVAVWASGGTRFLQLKKLNGYLGQVGANTLLYLNPTPANPRNLQLIVASHVGVRDGYIGLIQFFRLSDMTYMNELKDENVMGVYGVALAPPDRKRIIAVHWDTDYIYIWDILRGEVTEWIPAPHPLIEAIATSPDGEWVATAHAAGIVVLWKIRA